MALKRLRILRWCTWFLYVFKVYHVTLGGVRRTAALGSSCSMSDAEAADAGVSDGERSTKRVRFAASVSANEITQLAVGALVCTALWIA